MRYFVIGIILLLLLGCASQQSAQLPLKVVSALDLKSYQGVWFEIYRIPNRFQSHCVKGSQAEYRLRPDKQIGVVNSCITKAGELDEAIGVARLKEPGSPAQLEVSFFSILGWRPIWGNYYVIGLDKEYGYAVIGEPSRKFGWVLARDTSLRPEHWDRIKKVLHENGYSPLDFTESRH